MDPTGKPLSKKYLMCTSLQTSQTPPPYVLWIFFFFERGKPFWGNKTINTDNGNQYLPYVERGLAARAARAPSPLIYVRPCVDLTQTANKTRTCFRQIFTIRQFSNEFFCDFLRDWAACPELWLGVFSDIVTAQQPARLQLTRVCQPAGDHPNRSFTKCTNLFTTLDYRRYRMFLGSWALLCYPLNHKCPWLTNILRIV